MYLHGSLSLERYITITTTAISSLCLPSQITYEPHFEFTDLHPYTSYSVVVSNMNQYSERFVEQELGYGSQLLFTTLEGGMLMVKVCIDWLFTMRP